MPTPSRKPAASTEKLYSSAITEEMSILQVGSWLSFLDTERLHRTLALFYLIFAKFGVPFTQLSSWLSGGASHLCTNVHWQTGDRLLR